MSGSSSGDEADVEAFIASSRRQSRRQSTTRKRGSILSFRGNEDLQDIAPELKVFAVEAALAAQADEEAQAEEARIRREKRASKWASRHMLKNRRNSGVSEKIGADHSGGDVDEAPAVKMGWGGGTSEADIMTPTSPRRKVVAGSDYDRMVLMRYIINGVVFSQCHIDD